MVQTNLLTVTTQNMEYLAAVSEAELWGDAAAEVGVTPSALSQSLAELERRVGVTLFERSGRRRSLTADGEKAAEHAKHVLAAIGDLTRWAVAARAGRSGTVRLGLIDVAAVHHYPDAIKAFRTNFPEVELHLTVAASATLLNQVLSGQLDAALIVAPSQLPDNVTVTLAATEELAIYGPPNQPTGLPATWGPWVTFPAESHTRQHVARALRKLGAEFRIEAESHQPEVLRQMVELGMGWTVLPVAQAEVGPNPLVRAQRPPLLRRDLIVVQRAAASASTASTELIERLLASSTKPQTVEKSPTGKQGSEK